MKKDGIKILFKVVILIYFIIGVFGLLEDFSSRLSDWIVLGICIFIILSFIKKFNTWAVFWCHLFWA